MILYNASDEEIIAHAIQNNECGYPIWLVALSGQICTTDPDIAEVKFDHCEGKITVRRWKEPSLYDR